ncbi:MAG: hypothetical protein NTZ17_02640 [Phycisphaerae bacterium]|nr:hypothetical protein [Phycisphaerae bacterium]
MKRYTGQKALYEAISRSRAKARRGNILERFLPEGIGQEEPAQQEGQSQVEPTVAPPEASPPVAKEPPRPLPEKLREPMIVKEDSKLRRLTTVERVDAPPVVKPQFVEKVNRPAPRPGPVQTWWRLRPVQLNAGHVEISVPYHIGIVVVLVLTLALLAAFRIGQHSGAKGVAAVTAKTPARAAPQNAATETMAATTTQVDGSAVSAPGGSETPQKEGDHWIILAQHKNEADLRQVADYFAAHGIQLKVYGLAEVRQALKDGGYSAKLPSGDGYFLATRFVYSNPDKPGTDGYEVKQKIIELGQGYKASRGFESFAAKHFSDAYGMKITKMAGEK